MKTHKASFKRELSGSPRTRNRKLFPLILPFLKQSKGLLNYCYKCEEGSLPYLEEVHVKLFCSLSFYKFWENVKSSKESQFLASQGQYSFKFGV